MLYHVSGGGPLPRCRYATLPTVIDATAASRTVRAYARSTPAVCQSIHPPSIFPSDSARVDLLQTIAEKVTTRLRRSTGN